MDAYNVAYFRTNEELWGVLAAGPQQLLDPEPLLLVNEVDRYPINLYANGYRLVTGVERRHIERPLRETFGRWASVILTPEVWSWLDRQFATANDWFIGLKPIPVTDIMSRRGDFEPDSPLRVYHPLQDKFMSATGRIDRENKLKLLLPDSILSDIVRTIQTEFCRTIGLSSLPTEG